ncbi:MULTISPECIES: C1 family peptidase [Lactobacillus]|uniref:C1 family peptidase n=1 Tax=Lactobacillus TaxID=1578 RepID=UPI001C699A27|nr:MULTISPECIES: C1 family peptidase [Lactobacillus]MCO6532301.1 aminopeptidase C [Lactobacillus sp.]MCO6533794.1 aminopeptidase C [Lactobacillus sp.]MCO6536261.1 aminopeptidase C [Lactobacillus sp.]MCT6820877.1 aminopeptidase C [Lactobacillus panisapium]MCT6854419.1 aminopeptidase C [Lactobacillus panisapium]
MTKEITNDAIANYTADLAKHPSFNIASHAAQENGIYKASQNLQSKIDLNPTFSVEIETGKPADQKQSGRCWMFSALNTMRHPLQKEYKVKDFELSQNYTNFWDKFEKSNWFFENVIASADKPLGDRKVSFLFTTPQQDGGQWDMLCGLIEKYGIVPKSVYPETANATNSSALNDTLNTLLRKDGLELRDLVNSGKSEDEVEARKNEFLNDVFRILAISLGVPPKKFDFEYKDDDGNYHREAGITPKEFFDKYVGMNLEDHVSIINSPTDDKPYHKVFSVEYLGNVVGGRQVRHLNLTINEMKDLIIKQLKAGEVVWFGSNVGKDSERQLGLLDTNIYKRDELFDVDFSMTKAERLDSTESMMDHAMVITGVDLVDDKPTKWKIENSWGEKPGFKGYFVMSDSWFDSFVYQAVINKKFLPDDMKKEFDDGAKNPIQLLPWDPMGALAFK